MKLAYRAFDRAGREVTDVIDALGPVEATEQLRRKELFVADISPADMQDSPHKPAGRKSLLPPSKSQRLRNLSLFTRQLHVLVHSGTPLAQGLYALERQAKDSGWREVIADVRSRLEGGASLSESMSHHKDYFDDVCCNMVAAGESSGKLPVVLNRLSQLTRKRLHIRSTLRGAMIYPCLLTVVTVAVIMVLLLFVIPRFAELFDSLGVPLPPTTAALIGLSNMLRSYWWLLLIALGGGAVGLRKYLQTPSGRRMQDKVVLRLPIIGQIARDFATARIARMLGTLLDSHLHIIEVLQLVRGATANVYYAELMAKAEDAVGRGEPISSAFQNTDLISPSVYEATRSGEQSGQVAPLLLNLADCMDEENEVTLRSLTTIIEPVMLILMGLVVGIIALGLFIPLFDITAMTSGGG